MNEFDEVKQELKARVKGFALSFLKKPQETEQAPSNFGLYLVLSAAFVLLAILDLITAIVVGGMTNFWYGILTFGVGIVPTIVNEIGFFRAYANKKQRNLAISGIVIGVLATLGIGVMAGIVSAANYFGIFDSTPFKSFIETAMLVSLVAISGIHVTIWMIYVFIDEGIRDTQNHAHNLAESNMRLKNLNRAVTETEIAIEQGKRLETLVDEGKGDIVDEAMRGITGKSIIKDSSNQYP